MATWDSVSASCRCLRGNRFGTVVPSLPRILKVHGIQGAPVSGLPLTKFGDIPTITLQHTYIYTHILALVGQHLFGVHNEKFIRF